MSSDEKQKRKTFLILANEFFKADKDAKFVTATGLEGRRLNDFQNTRINDAGLYPVTDITETVFAELAYIATDFGHPPPETFGDLCDDSGLNQYDLHRLGCSRDDGGVITGAEVISRLENLLEEMEANAA